MYDMIAAGKHKLMRVMGTLEWVGTTGGICERFLQISIVGFIMK